jgi:hypothetical protein
MNSTAGITFRSLDDYPQTRDRAAMNTCGCGFCGTSASLAARYFADRGAILFPTDFQNTGASLDARLGACLHQFPPGDEDSDVL